jgi:hypothetical protein
VELSIETIMERFLLVLQVMTLVENSGKYCKHCETLEFITLLVLDLFHDYLAEVNTRKMHARSA